ASLTSKDTAGRPEGTGARWRAAWTSNADESSEASRPPSSPEAPVTRTRIAVRLPPPLAVCTRSHLASFRGPCRGERLECADAVHYVRGNRGEREEYAGAPPGGGAGAGCRVDL